MRLKAAGLPRARTPQAPGYALPAMPPHMRLLFGGLEVLDTLCGHGLGEDDVVNFRAYLEGAEEDDSESEEGVCPSGVVEWLSFFFA